jgi:exodeoxyribonuclease-3
MKLFCWNVNGYRAVQNKDYQSWATSIKADVICLQEVKSHEHQVDPKALEMKGYHRFWNAAQKPGYSGTATWSKIEPISYKPGFGVEEYDSEGRTQIFEFKNFFLVNSYFPNSQPERARMKYKLGFLAEMQKFCKSVQKKGKEIVVCGDYNVAHTEMDIKNAKSNQDSPGFCIEERDWMTGFLKTGMHDVFRERHPNEPSHYTWWSYRANARMNNVGWRIDYHCVSEGLLDRVKNVGHQPEVHGSDHCPIFLEIKD